MNGNTSWHPNSIPETNTQRGRGSLWLDLPGKPAYGRACRWRESLPEPFLGLQLVVVSAASALLTRAQDRQRSCQALTVDGNASGCTQSNPLTLKKLAA